jgi:hypothetical protein
MIHRMHPARLQQRDWPNNVLHIEPEHPEILSVQGDLVEILGYLYHWRSSTVPLVLWGLLRQRP